MQPPVQVTEVVLQVLPVGRPRHLVHPRRGIRVDRPIRVPEPVNVHLVQQRGEPCLPCLVLPPAAHGPAHWSRRARPCVRDAFCWPCSPWSIPFPPPAPRSPRRPCSSASQVLRDRPTSPTRSSQDYRLGVPWASRPLITRTGGRGISRFSRMKVPYMPWFFDHAGSNSASR